MITKAVNRTTFHLNVGFKREIYELKTNENEERTLSAKKSLEKSIKRAIVLRWKSVRTDDQG